jgi:hypothetical protein
MLDPSEYLRDGKVERCHALIEVEASFVTRNLNDLHHADQPED